MHKSCSRPCVSLYACADSKVTQCGPSGTHHPDPIRSSTSFYSAKHNTTKFGSTAALKSRECNIHHVHESAVYDLSDTKLAATRTSTRRKARYIRSVKQSTEEKARLLVATTFQEWQEDAEAADDKGKA